MRVLPCLLAFAAVLGAESLASAQLQGTLSVDATGTWLPSTPSMTFDQGSDGPYRSPSGSTAKLGFPLGFLGVGGQLNLLLSQHWYLPLLGATFSTAVGPSPRAIVSVDGSIGEVRPWAAKLFDASAVGLGYRAKVRRWLFAADITIGVAFLTMPGTVATGLEVQEAATMAFTPTLRVDVQGCRRLDPENRFCLVLQPKIYEWGWMNGASVSLRWEFGQ